MEEKEGVGGGCWGREGEGGIERRHWRGGEGGEGKRRRRERVEEDHRRREKSKM